MKLSHVVYLIIILVVGLWSGINSYEPTLWCLEAGLCIIGLAILVVTYRKFPLSEVTYFFIMIHFIILLVGAHYSYAKVPAFDWLKEYIGGSRNNYDKLGHFAQGFVPAFIAREIIIRLNVVRKTSWIPFFVISICLAISAFYEMIEWSGALVFTQSAEDFLGTQGYEWDTQSDMFCALIGASCMLMFFSKIQDKSIAKVTHRE